MQTGIQEVVQAGRNSGGKTTRQIRRQIEKPSNREADRQSSRQTEFSREERPVGRESGRQSSKQTGKKAGMRSRSGLKACILYIDGQESMFKGGHTYMHINGQRGMFVSRKEGRKEAGTDLQAVGRNL